MSIFADVFFCIRSTFFGHGKGVIYGRDGTGFGRLGMASKRLAEEFGFALCEQSLET